MAEPGATTTIESKEEEGHDLRLSLQGIAEMKQYPYNQTKDSFYFMSSIKAPLFIETDGDNMHNPIDLICVVDESSSMGGDRIDLVKETLRFIIDNLSDLDSFGIVGYSNTSHIRLPLTKMNSNGQTQARASLAHIRASGVTALCDGLLTGIKMMNERVHQNGISSVLLLTDGEANRGYTTAEEIIEAIKGKPVVKATDKSNVRHGDWVCPYCSDHNFASRNVCRKCGKGTKPKGLKGRAGDWDCPQCGVMNFAKRNQCFKCHTKKPKEPVQPKEEEAKEKDIPFKLNCTINTFGFGADHNEDLLTKISEFGNGMYVYIQDTSMIADSFAECLGGLVSVFGLDLKVKVEALNGVGINRCLSTGYDIVAEDGIYNIFIKNIQSEEHKDLLFELSLNQYDKMTAQDIVKVTLEYLNVEKDKKEELVVISSINRVEDGAKEDGANMELDKQLNRVFMIEAMDKAEVLAHQNQLDEARSVLSVCQKKLEVSESKDDAFTKNLVVDIQRLNENMKDKATFKQKGGKMLKMNKKSHALQRSVQSSEYVSQSAYQNQSKILMKDKFVRGDWYCDLCKYKNFAKNAECRQCKKGKRPKRQGHWDCPQCGVLNFAWRKRCFKCNTPVPPTK
eukprot:29490_1